MKKNIVDNTNTDFFDDIYYSDLLFSGHSNEHKNSFFYSDNKNSLVSLIIFLKT